MQLSDTCSFYVVVVVVRIVVILFLMPCVGCVILLLSDLNFKTLNRFSPAHIDTLLYSCKAPDVIS